MTTDAMGMWFRARLSAGIDDRLFIGVVLPDGTPEWHPHSHAEGDGIGWFYHFLREANAKFDPMPDARESHPPSLFKLWRQGALRSREPHPMSWKSFDDKDLSDGNGPDHGISVFTLDEPTTTALKQQARASGYSLLTWLLWTLNNHAMASFCDGGEGCRWLMPVNLRGAVNLPVERMNHASGVSLDIDRNASIDEVRAELVGKLKSGEYWWAWRLARASRFFGQAGVNWLYRKVFSKVRCAGSLTSVGDWKIDWSGSAYPEGTALIACPPASPSYPVGSGFVLTNGQLTVSLRIHPYLNIGRARQDRFLQEWMGELMEQLGGTPAVDMPQFRQA